MGLRLNWNNGMMEFWTNGFSGFYPICNTN
jgi:hypothetical protein